MCLYVESGLRWGLQHHREDKMSTENSSYYLSVVVDSRDTTESRLAGVKKAEKEPDWQTIERAHASTTKGDFERMGAVDVEDPCFLTFAGRGIGTVADSVSKRQGLVRLWKHEHRGAMFAAVLATHRDSMRRSMRRIKGSRRGRKIHEPDDGQVRVGEIWRLHCMFELW
jgi:hypothetical protein